MPNHTGNFCGVSRVASYRKKAEQGCAMGQYNLACCYEHGVAGASIAKNEQLAIKWYTEAADQNYHPAKEALIRMKSLDAEVKNHCQSESIQAKVLIGVPAVISTGAAGFGLWATIVHASIGQLSLGLGLGLGFGLGLTVLSGVVWPVAAAAGIVALYFLNKHGYLDGIKQRLFCCAATSEEPGAALPAVNMVG